MNKKLNKLDNLVLRSRCASTWKIQLALKNVERSQLANNSS